MTRLRLFAALAVAVLVTVFASPALAHKPSDSYLTLTVADQVVRGRWDIALRDLSYALDVDVDADGNGEITWGEVTRARARLTEYALGRLVLRGDDTTCPISAAGPLTIASHSDGSYAVLAFEARCASEIHALRVDYQLLFDLDPQHRGLLRLEGTSSRTHVFHAQAHDARFDLASTGRLTQLGVVVREGVIHIWKGYDHVLFLLALLLPSVLRREDRRWIPAARLRPALLDVLRIVTAFTVAHSITLSLAALEVVTLPSRLVESAIAASVVLAAVNNLYPVLREDRWAAAFLLGLMHGFGFSSTLVDLELPRANLVLTLFGFNLGVELGQVAIVCLFVPLAYAVRSTVAYRRGMLGAGSAGILALALVWLVERAMLVKILP